VSAEDLARWEACWRARPGPVGAPEPFLVEAMAGVLPGPVLDVAAGDGRNALWLARRGDAVTAVDVAPAAIARLQAAADAEGLKLVARAADLDEADALAGLGPFAVLVVVRFKPTPGQWDRLLATLKPGGTLVFCTFRREHHAAHGFPLAYCVERDELTASVEPRLRLLRWRDLDEGDARLAGSVWERSPD
jgi:SAM-dependent methyltransferase